MSKYLSVLFLPTIACPAIAPLINSSKIAPTPLDHLTYVTIGDTNNIAITGFQPEYQNTTELNIQATYKINQVDYTVTQIGDYDVNNWTTHNNFGFYHNNLKNVILPSTIERITDFAFAEQRCPWTMNDQQSQDLRNNWVTNFDLSKCNDLGYIGAYAFQCDTFNEFKLPQNNYVLTNLGDDAFSGVRFYHDLDFRGFKSLNTIGEWEFYGAENGKGDQGGKKIMLPVNEQYTMAPNIFTWSDAGTIDFNTTEFPTSDVGTKVSGRLGMTTPKFSFALSDFKEIHVQRNANLDTWAAGIERNATGIEILGQTLPAIYHVDKLIADLNPDGSRGTPTDMKVNLGPSWMNNIPFDIAFKDVLKLILQLPIPFSPWHLYDLTNNLVKVDQYINGVNYSLGSKLMYDALALLLANPHHPDINDPWTMKMVQSEMFCIWDRVFKYQ